MFGVGRSFRPGKSGGVGAHAFAPSDISGLVMDLDAEGLTGADGSSVSSWVDAVNAAHSASLLTGTPTLKLSFLNGHKVVRFPGDTELGLNWQPFDPTQPFTLYLVMRNDNADNATVIESVSTANPSQGVLIRYKNTGEIRLYGQQDIALDVTNPVAAGSFGYFTFLDGASASVAGALTIRVNGVQKGTNTPAVRYATNWYNPRIGGVTIGLPLTGYMARILGYQGLHNSTQYAQVETYIASRYGL